MTSVSGTYAFPFAEGAGTPPTDPSIGQLAANASTHLSTIVRGEIALAKSELKVSVKNGGIGAGLFAAAAVVLTFSLTFLFVMLAELIHFFGLWRWASYGIVFAVLLLVAAALAFVGLAQPPQKPVRIQELSR